MTGRVDGAWLDAAPRGAYCPRMTRELLTTDELAERLKVSRRTVQRRMAAGEIPHLQFGGAVRFDWEAVLRTLRQANDETAKGGAS